MPISSLRLSWLFVVFIFLGFSLIKAIRFPFLWVLFYVFGNTVHFGAVAHYMVLVARLPCEWNGVFVGVTGNGRFKTTDNVR